MADLNLNENENNEIISQQLEDLKGRLLKFLESNTDCIPDDLITFKYMLDQEFETLLSGSSGRYFSMEIQKQSSSQNVNSNVDPNILEKIECIMKLLNLSMMINNSVS